MLLVPCGDRRACYVKEYVDLVAAQDAELVPPSQLRSEYASRPRRVVA